MRKKYTKDPMRIIARTIMSAAFAVLLLAGTTFADDIRLNMEGSTATVPKGNTITRKLFGVPDFGGTLKLRYKWHAVSLIPNTFNFMKVVVRKGSTTLSTKSACYSTHASLAPKCDLTLTVSNATANSPGDWLLIVTNNSGDEVIGFDIEKGSDINPFIPSFRSVYTPNCPSTINLDLEGADTTTITKGATVTRKIFGVGNNAGNVVLKAKWHAINILPTFAALKIDVLRPNGTPHSSSTYYSIHSSSSPKFELAFNITAAQAALPGDWSLRITNNSGFEVIGFNIARGSDINPLVPRFGSTYKATCP